MQLSKAQIEWIKQDVTARGISFEELAESLVDHICCSIEASSENNFENAYRKAISGFGDDSLEDIQHQTIFLLTLKRETIMKKTMFVLGYIAAALTTFGLLFKVMHWPGANIMLILGVAMLNFGFLPLYFSDRYKKALN